jgi:Peptidase M15.
MTNLSKSFTLAEMTYSSTAIKHKTPNVPNDAQIKNLTLLCTNILQPLRDKIGKPIKINSGFRSAAVNKLVGGVSTSAHCFGLAADIVCPTYGNAKEFCKYVEKFLKDNKIEFDQLIYEYNSWVHIGIKHRDGRQRKQVITINSRGTFVGIV